MLRRLFLLAVNALAAAFVVDRLLARRRGGRPPAPLRMMVVVDSPLQETWDVVADIPLQIEWMTEMRSI